DGIASSPPNASAAVAKPEETSPPGSRKVTIIDGSSGARKLVTIPGNPDATAQPLFDPKLVEATRHGAIPKIGPDGTRPSSRYAQPRQLPPNKKDSPLIAVVVGGLGISASGTADALANCPRQLLSRWRLTAPILKNWPSAPGRSSTNSCCRCRWSPSTI